MQEVNQIANFTFLTQETNLKVSNQDPAIYLEGYASKQPEVLESHWIPMDPELWKLDKYPDFLDERRKLLAAAANRFLDSLISGTVPEHPASIGAMERPEAVGGIVSSEEEQVLLDTNIWVTARGLPGGELGYELVDENTGELRATLDLAWPEGVQEGYSLPVALLIDEGSEVERMANQSGFRSFTSADDFKSYVCSEILGLSTIQN